MTNEHYSGFEQGPIRPPSEAESLLIRVTRNCPWNQCTFCGLYKNTKFSIRPVDHVLNDIDIAAFYVQAILDAQRSGQAVYSRDLMGLIPPSGTPDHQALYSAFHFVQGGMESIFIQDGNSFVIKPQDIIQILKHLQQQFPQVQRITSYARSHSLARISDDDLVAMASAGLNRIHIGLESASDTVLARSKKGVDKATQILAGQKVKKAGIQLSEYFMPGLGGKTLSKENALETADAMNQINPDFIRLRTLALPPSSPLADEYQRGLFDKMGEVDTAAELLLFLDNLEGIQSVVKSDHILNLFPEVDGVLPQDKQQITKPLRDFLALPPEEQMLFCIGRRHHQMSRISDLRNPTSRAYAQQTCTELGATVDNYDTIISRITENFI